MLIEGILGIVIGILVFVFPIQTTFVLIYLIAAWLIVRGIFSIVSGSSAKSGLPIAMGVVALILGIFVLFRPPAYAMATLLGFIEIKILIINICIILL